MRKRETRPVNPPRWFGWLRWAFPVAAVIGLFAAGGVLYAAHTENNDAFCASCHTEPESTYFQRSQADAVDLASSHAGHEVTCIQCHSGPGATGRLTAMTDVAAPDLAAYLSGKYHHPAIVTVPISDANCVKCHADVTTRQDFRNHFHVFLSQWQALAPGKAATCVDCHQAHVTGGQSNASFLLEAPTRQVCQNCHAFAGQN